MPQFGSKSLKILEELEPRLRDVLVLAISVMDFTVLCGFRGKAEQERLYRLGMSKVTYPNSKHNTYPSRGVDIAPYPVDWDDAERFYMLAGVIKACAYIRKTKIRWGGDWDSDGDLHDQSFMDLGHFELED